MSPAYFCGSMPDRAAIKRCLRPRLRGGFTLLEVVVVIGILAVLAGLLVPQLANMWRPAQTAAEADTQAELMNYLSLYEARTQSYPTQFDSLMGSDGSAGYAQMSKDVFGGKKKLTLTTLTDDTTNGKYFTSLKKAGITTVMWHDETVSPPSNSGTILHTLAAGDTLATINPSAGPFDTPRQDPQAAIYPAGLPDGVKLIVLGIGPSCTAVGVTMASAPISPHPESYLYYRRYLAVFAAYADGTRARLKAVLDRHADTLDDTLRKYQEESQAK